MRSLRCAIYFIITPRTRQSWTRFGFRADEHVYPTVVGFATLDGCQLVVGGMVTVPHLQHEERGKCQRSSEFGHGHTHHQNVIFVNEMRAPGRVPPILW